MKERIDRQKLLTRRRLVAIFLVVLLLALLVEGGITWMLCRKSAEESTTLLLNQIETILKENKQDERKETWELKQDYISHAKAIAYTLSLDPSLRYHAEELKTLCTLHAVDEINIFDTTGTIYAGTEPAYYGYSFDSGEQIGYFKPMLKNRTLSMCQGVTPNTAEGKSMMYAIAWDAQGKNMIQVGVKPTRLLNELEKNDISRVIDSVLPMEGFTIDALEKGSLQIVASTEETLVGTEVSPVYAEKIGAEKAHTGQGIIRYEGGYYYCNYSPIGDYVMVVAYDMGNSLGNILVPLAVIAVYLILAGVGMLHLFLRLSRVDAEKERQGHALADYSRIMSSTGFGLWHILLKDGEAPRMQPNEKMTELLALTAEALTEEEIYASWYSRVLPEAVPALKKTMGEMMGGQFAEHTCRWNHPDKGVIYVRFGGTSEREEDGTLVLSGYYADVTELVLEDQRHRAELAEATQKAQAANVAKTAFLFHMSHDIRTPMNAIIGYTDLLEKNAKDPEKCRDYLEKLRLSSDFLLSLINNVLEMARIESGKAVLEETVFPVGMILEEVFSVYAELMKKKNITFRRSSTVKDRYIYGDTVKLKEVFLNIVSNAHKYTPEGGTVTIETRELPSEQPGMVCIQSVVTDTGIGMSKEYLPTLFEEFSRERSSTEAKVQGTGLGMPIVKKMVDLMGGTITVESELGKGTTFTVTLHHRVADPVAAQPEQEAAVDTERFTGRRILLAEDNDLNAEIAIEILSEVGFAVERAEDGVICVDMLQKAPCGYYDVILMDIQMPNMDGYRATQVIRTMKDSCRNQIPIFAMTANAFEEDRKAALAAGMNGHLAKPIDVSKLMAALSSVLP